MDWSEVIEKAIVLSAGTGYLTFDQVNGLITEPVKAEPEDVEALLTALSDKGIRVGEK
jgi:hypothetical protein